VSLGEQRTCYCGAPFAATRHNRAYCSLRCKTLKLTRAYRARLRAKRPPPEPKPCGRRGCRRRVPQRRRLYCSARCRSVACKRVERALARARIARMTPAAGLRQERGK
jgi:hypothetical protein